MKLGSAPGHIYPVHRMGSATNHCQPCNPLSWFTQA